MTWPHVSSATLTHATSGNWDDTVFIGVCHIRNLDGSMFRSADGYAWVQYSGSNYAMQQANGADNDRPGLYKTRDFVTFTKVTVSAPFLTWDNGTYSQNGTSWDGRVVQAYAIIWDGSQFIIFYAGDSHASGTEHYNFGIATCPGPTPDGTWTKYGSNPTFSYVNAMYGGDVVYDRFDTNANKRWKQWFMDNTSGGEISVKLATAPSYTGPWTVQNSGNPVYVCSLDHGFSSGNIASVWQMPNGTFHMLYDIFDKSYSQSTYVGWTAIINTSADGITWTENTTPAFSNVATAWEQYVCYGTLPIWDPVYGVWRLIYSGGSTALVPGSDLWELGLAIGCSTYPSPASPEDGPGRFAITPGGAHYGF